MKHEFARVPGRLDQLSIAAIPNPMFDLRGRRALVTGGARSRGFAIAETLARAGADVAITTSHAIDAALGLPNAGPEAVSRLEALGVASFLIDADFSFPNQAGRVIGTAHEVLGGIDILVICASVQERSSFEAVEMPAIQRQIDVNFISAIELLQLALPAMRSRGWGRVLNIGSINAIKPAAELPVYAATKAAQHNLVLNLAKLCAIDGVTVNTLSPGIIATERNRWRRRDQEEWTEIQRGANPMQRAGEVHDVVGAALLLCSDAGGFITGVDLAVDGGAHLR
jgi:NAD(P)-dependent dehydrogenase (short-subunit alcohol dehydrogenase family)